MFPLYKVHYFHNLMSGLTYLHLQMTTKLTNKVQLRLIRKPLLWQMLVQNKSIQLI